MAGRWVLARAGIVNVYQYARETLEFAGGRLLLRGVNGSGKSTAMNMLLPFLIDGDVRRIDAAGEQAGVLRSWMLSGRDDAQPVGYLWIEFERNDEHLACGCGIRANRASDSVQTWWFVTDKRPEIDFPLVEERHPLSYERLRDVLSGDPLYRHDQRAAYRTEIRERLFGGADLDGHIRLLNVVRNPRVGDRIDLELPDYLTDALPPLSDHALDDAAQPLDDLEEHRANVENLARTASALGAIAAVYTGYARTEMRGRAATGRDIADRARNTAQRAERASSLLEETSRTLDECIRRIEELKGDDLRLEAELAALRVSPAYQERQQLDELRNLVGVLRAEAERADARVESSGTAMGGRLRALEREKQAAGDDRTALVRDLELITGLLIEGTVTHPAPATPVIEVASIGKDDRGNEVVAPPSDPDLESVRVQLRSVRDAAVGRLGEIDTLDRELVALGKAAEALERAARAVADAESERDVLEQDAAAMAGTLADAVSAWRLAAGEWRQRLDAHRRIHELAPLDDNFDPDSDVGTIEEALRGAVEATRDEHCRVEIDVEHQADTQRLVVEDLALALAVLERAQLPEPPALTWQRRDGGVSFAETVDFRDSVDETERAGLEAALEAAGLLGAEVREGSLTLEDGTLLLRAGPAAARPLSELLVADVETNSDLDRASITALLDSISISPETLDHSGATTTTVDGRFRIGLVEGMYSKEAAEHIGTTARRAALERRREHARFALGDAEHALVMIEDDLAEARARGTETIELRESIPPTTEARQATLALQSARAAASRAEDRLEVRRGEQRDADAAHGGALDRSRISAASYGLPPERERLVLMRRAVDELRTTADRTQGPVTGYERSVVRWRSAAQTWTDAAEQHAGVSTEAGDAHRRLDVEGARLATLEDALGSDYDEVMRAVESCTAELDGTRAALKIAQEERDGLVVARADANAALRERVSEREESESDASRAVEDFQRVLSTPGFLDAAIDASGGVPEGISAPTEASAAGLSKLTDAVDASIPAPDRPDVTADSVRQSLRQRRDTLGSGWDAEDRQADPGFPLHVEVNGPEGRMPLSRAVTLVSSRTEELRALLTSEQDQALRHLLQGLVAHELATKLHAARALVERMNQRLAGVTTTHGVGASLRWRVRDVLEEDLVRMIGLLERPPDLRTDEQEADLRSMLTRRLDDARRDKPDSPYRELVDHVLDYRSWHEMAVYVHRPGRSDERLTRRTALSEGEKKLITYLPLFAAVAASCDSLADSEPTAPRFLLLDDAFAKVSEDNHAKLFGLLVAMDLDFIATSERLWGTHETVPELAIAEVIRDAELGVIVIEHSRWDGNRQVAVE